MITNLGEEKEGVVPKDNHVDRSTTAKKKTGTFYDKRNSCNDDRTSCSMEMIGLINLFFLYSMLE